MWVSYLKFISEQNVSLHKDTKFTTINTQKLIGIIGGKTLPQTVKSLFACKGALYAF